MLAFAVVLVAWHSLLPVHRTSSVSVRDRQEREQYK